MPSAFSPLKRHFLWRLTLVTVAISALLLAFFLIAYRERLIEERSQASLGFNLLLQAALENAMLKRDVPGLADIVTHLGRQPGMRGVMILNPEGEVRFASRSDRLGARLPTLVPAADAPPSAGFRQDENGIEVLRSINPVRNQAPCQQCHGPVTDHPVNGILVVDYDAGEIQAHAWQSAALLALGGICTLSLMLAVLWRLLQRQVIEPVAALSRTSASLEAGRPGERVELPGDNELTALGARFNRMAERIEAQMALLRVHETYLQEILDSLPDGIRVIRCQDKKIMLANRAFCAQLGKTGTAVLDHPCHAVSHGRDAPCISTLVICPLNELNRVGDCLKATHYHQRADGSAFAAEIHAALIELDAGQGRERYVIESIRDLGQAARVSHEQRLSELGLLAAGIAHEIHNPLGSVRLGVQGLAREVESGCVRPEQIADYLRLIDQEIDNCIAVTRRLLLLARPPSSSLQLVVVNDALRDTLSLLEFDAQARGIRQQLELPDVSLRILADEAEIRMIILNLAQNAHHAMPQGGLLRARLAQNGPHAEIEITDSGVGMEPELLAHIFDPFFSHRADGVSGTGLGLTIVKNFVERMDGTIDVESGPGQGSRFRIRLPLAETAVEHTS
jgi:PAS domain S-box-containing protein